MLHIAFFARLKTRVGLMSDNIVQLVPSPLPRGSQSVIALLKDLLEAAKLGNISDIAAAYLRPDRTGRTVWSASENLLAMTGIASILHQDLCRSAGDE